MSISPAYTSLQPSNAVRFNGSLLARLLLGKREKTGDSFERTLPDWSDEKLAEIGRRMVMSPIDELSERYTLVQANTAILDAAFQEQPSYYIDYAGGGSAIPGRYQQFMDYTQTMKPIYTPVITLDISPVSQKLRAKFTDGRHTFAVLRDHGMAKIPVALDKESLELAKDYGLI